MYNGYVTRIKNLHKHPNADRLQIGECFGNNVIVSLDYTPDMLGVYFPSDGQLSLEFAEQNNLLRKKDEAGNNIGGYMDPDKRNITAVKLRGEKSDGLFLPLSCLSYTGIQLSDLTEGTTITVVNGHEICQKYIPKTNCRYTCSDGSQNKAHKKKIKKIDIAPLFQEHVDTEQLNYNLEAFKPGDLVEITLKMHGTSQRTGYLPVFKKYKKSFMDIIRRRDGKPIYEYNYISGTRRVVLSDYEGGFYGSNAFREKHSKFFEGKLWKGETVYYEVVGFTDTGVPIMNDANNKKLNDKEFIKQYGETTRFSYGCEPAGKVIRHGRDDISPYSIELEAPQSDVYVYRMTMTNEDGCVVEYAPDFMRYRCEQMGVKSVPVFWQGYIPTSINTQKDTEGNEVSNITPGEFVKDIAEQYYDGPDPIGKTHIREGVVCRIVNRPKFTAYKTKNWFFKALEGIVKVDAKAPDMEEAQDETVEKN